MVGNGEEPQRRQSRRFSGRLKGKSLMQPIWPGRLREERGTTACRMTWVCRMMSLGMVLPQGDTTRSSIHGTQQTGIDSGTSHDQSERKWVGSSTRGAGLLHTGAKHLGLKDAHRSTDSPPAKDNEEVNAHVKRLQATLDATTMVDSALDRDDEAICLLI
jgi:hypothetical protein